MKTLNVKSFAVNFLFTCAANAGLAACDLSLTYPGENDVVRTLTDGDIGALRTAGSNNFDVTGCDVSGVNNFNSMFAYPGFNQDISAWDVSSATDMSFMFRFSLNFNQDISSWDVSNVTNMRNMFSSARDFNQDLSGWDVSNVTNMSSMFNNADAFSGDISSWNVSSVRDMSYMFINSSFNGDISNWNVSSVAEMRGMFQYSPFNQNIRNWDVSNVSDMRFMFTSSQFNQDLSTWDVGNVTDMGWMFTSTVFDQDIGDWNVSNVRDFDSMFRSNSAFNQDLRLWDVSAIPLEPMAFAYQAWNFSTYNRPIWGISVSRPSVSITTDAQNTIHEAFDITIQFSERVWYFGEEDVLLSNAQISSFTMITNSEYTASVSPLASGVVTISIPAEVAHDIDLAPNTASAEVTVEADLTEPTVLITGPDVKIETTFQTEIKFSEVVNDFTIEDITVQNGTKTNLSGSGKEYQLYVTPVLGSTVRVYIEAGKVIDVAGNPNTASNVYSVSTINVRDEFEKVSKDLQRIISRKELNDLKSDIRANMDLTRDLRNDMIKRKSNPNSNFGDRINFDVDGDAVADVTQFKSAGTFFGVGQAAEDNWRHRIVGDYEFSHAWNGETTYKISTKLLLEQEINKSTVAGYYVGFSATSSKIQDSLSGEFTGKGLQLGLYAAHELHENLFLNGFWSYGVNETRLDLSNRILKLNSNYNTRSNIVGVSVSGRTKIGILEVRPELAFVSSRAKIGQLGLTGEAYGLVDNGLRLNLPDIEYSMVSLKPEFVLHVLKDNDLFSESELGIAPFITCENSSVTNNGTSCFEGLGVRITSDPLGGFGSFEYAATFDGFVRPKQTHKLSIKFLF